MALCDIERERLCGADGSDGALSGRLLSCLLSFPLSSTAGVLSRVVGVSSGDVEVVTLLTLVDVELPVDCFEVVVADIVVNIRVYVI